FQAEDGIRDKLVTGVQTCALPISRSRTRRVIHFARICRYSGSKASTCFRATPCGSLTRRCTSISPSQVHREAAVSLQAAMAWLRSEERRVGKEGRARGWRDG